MIRREVALIGTASPRPTPATAVLMPITRPRESASAPPELPGLSAASVWMTSSTIRVALRVWIGSDRPSPLTMPGADAAGHAERVADGDHQGADLQVVDVAVDRRVGDRPVGPHHREVGQRVAADDLEPGHAPVGERRLPGVGVADHVGVGDQVALAGQRHRRPDGLPGPAAPAYPDRGHPRQQHLRDARDHLRVRVQRVVVRRVSVGHVLWVPWLSLGWTGNDRPVRCSVGPVRPQRTGRPTAVRFEDPRRCRRRWTSEETPATHGAIPPGRRQRGRRRALPLVTGCDTHVQERLRASSTGLARVPSPPGAPAPTWC